MHHVPGPLAVRHQRLELLPKHPPLAGTDHVVTYVAAGWLRMNQGGALKAEAGSLLLLPAGAPHEPLEGHDLELWIIRFCPSCFTLDETQSLMTPFRRVRHGALPVVSIPQPRRQRVVQLYRELDAEQQLATPESPDLLRSMLLLLLGEIHRAMPAAAPHREAPTSFVPEALAFIQRRALEPISLRDVAAAVRRAPAHVAATVKQQTGHTVGDWITSVRLAESASRLVHTDDSLTAIAERVGWQDQTHFIRQFRKAFGATPAAWRRGQPHTTHQGPGSCTVKKSKAPGASRLPGRLRLAHDGGRQRAAQGAQRPALQAGGVGGTQGGTKCLHPCAAKRAHCAPFTSARAASRAFSPAALIARVHESKHEAENETVMQSASLAQAWCWSSTRIR